MSIANETITAIATPAGAGSVGIVRLSGSRARMIGSTLCNAKLKPRYAHFTHFTDGNGGVIDQGIVLYFPGPHSFTGEDVVELQAHGSPIVLEQLVKRVCALGARLARAGEFSERAYLNGKIDLTQAEAIADLIASQSNAQARAALRSLHGEFSQYVRALQTRLEKMRLYIEAALDFPEEEIDFLSDKRLVDELSALMNAITSLLTQARRGQRLRDGVHAVLIGRPNAGKSSLLNALAGTDRAIVTAIAGTTRDLLREYIQIDGVALTIIDTAGLRPSADAIEQEGMRRARSELEHADLALIVLDPADTDAINSLRAEAPAQAQCIVIHNKLDLHDAWPTAPTKSNAAPNASTADSLAMNKNEIHLYLSAKTGEGMDQLRAALKQFAGIGDGSGGEFSARARHVAALERVAEHIAQAEQRLHIEHAGELAAEELRMAQQALSELTGEYRADDLLGAIFSSFCIGK